MISMNLLSVLVGFGVSSIPAAADVSQAQIPARMDPPLAETPDTSSLHGQHKIICDGKIIAVAAAETKNSWLLTQASAAGSQTSSDVQFSLKIRFALGVFAGQTQLVVKRG
jgi:hypothetical protein